MRPPCLPLLKGFRVYLFIYIYLFFPLSIFLIQCSCYSDTNNNWGSISNAFLFSLRKKEGLGPFKSNVTTPSQAIYKFSSYGAYFGNGDIYIADNANSNNNSFTDFGNSYSVPSGVQDKYTILAGTYHFSPDEVKVFYLD